MTDELSKKLDDHKYEILYYLYFVGCILLAVWIAKPADILGSLI